MFHGWDNFYLLIGTAAGALIGLLFVVATLTAGREQASVSRGVALYTTPTVFHFALVLVLSAIALAPDVPARAAGAIVGACALAGLIYTASIAVRLRYPQSPDPPHWSDFWCYGAAPTATYLGLSAAAASVWAAPTDAPYGTALALLVLLMVGIRNAWDLVTWLAPRRSSPADLPDIHDHPAR